MHNTPSLINKNIYQFGIIEYNSRYVWSYFGTRKDQVYAIFQYWLDTEFTQLRSLNPEIGQVTLVGDSGEAKSKNMKSLLVNYAIKQIFTSYNTPEQNALMERVWRTLGEMATCMLLDAELPETFWEEARRYATFIYNRLPPARKPKVGPWQSPQELTFKVSSTPMLTHLKPFGAKCSVFIPTSKRGTKSHSDRGQIGQFIGIEEDGIILYRVYLPATREIAVSSDVKFHNRGSTAMMDTLTTSPHSIIHANAQKEARIGDDIPEMDIDEFRYLVGTRHIDSVDGLLYETTRVLEEGQYIVAYRRLVLQDGTVFQRAEDVPSM